MKIKLYSAKQAHAELLTLWPKIKDSLNAGHKLEIEVKREKRSLEQNSIFWAILTDLSKQVDWYGNKLTPEEWKIMLTASMKQQKTIPGIHGGFVVVGASTSQMTKDEMGELITIAHAFGDEKEVKWSPTSIGSFDES